MQGAHTQRSKDELWYAHAGTVMQAVTWATWCITGRSTPHCVLHCCALQHRALHYSSRYTKQRPSPEGIGLGLFGQRQMNAGGRWDAHTVVHQMGMGRFLLDNCRCTGMAGRARAHMRSSISHTHVRTLHHMQAGGQQYSASQMGAFVLTKMKETAGVWQCLVHVWCAHACGATRDDAHMTMHAHSTSPPPRIQRLTSVVCVCVCVCVHVCVCMRVCVCVCVCVRVCAHPEALATHQCCLGICTRAYTQTCTLLPPPLQRPSLPGPGAS